MLSSPNERLGELVAGNVGFALDPHDAFTPAEDTDNAFVSPHSTSIAPAIADAGAG